MFSKTGVMLFCMAAALPLSAYAQSAPQQSASVQAATWNAFMDELKPLGDRMIARLPARIRDNPQDQQEIGRLMLEAVVARTLEAINADPDHPVFLPFSNATLNIYQPNADTTYRTAAVSGGGVYRIRGDRGSLRILRMAEFATIVDEVKFSGPKPPVQALGTHDFNGLHVDDKGQFDVILSGTRPEGYTGEWWQLNPGTSYVVVRQVSSNWTTERDPIMSIERLDKPVERPRPSAADLEKQMKGLAKRISDMALSFVGHVEDLRNAGYINKLQIMHTPGALTGQFYYEGGYQLGPDDVLIVEAKVPNKCLYWSTILTNDIYETTDWVNNQSSLNDSQARVDKDGMVRFVVSMRDPGVPNWLDPAGYPSGAIQGRWTECDAQPIPKVTMVKFKDVRKALPEGTPTVTADERNVQVRERRMHFVQRPLW